MTVTPDVPVLQYNTLVEGRNHLSDVMDAAQDGLMINVARGKSARHRQEGSVSVVKTAALRSVLASLVSERVEAEVDENGVYVIAIRGLPLAAEGLTLADAADELASDVEFYHDEWVSRYRHAPNHEGNLPIAWLAQSMDRDQLAAWLLGEAENKLA